MIELRSDLDISLTPPPVLQGLNMSKFGVILDFEALQFWNKATYLIPNTNLGSIDEGCMSSQNLV